MTTPSTVSMKKRAASQLLKLPEKQLLTADVPLVQAPPDDLKVAPDNGGRKVEAFGCFRYGLFYQMRFTRLEFFQPV